GTESACAPDGTRTRTRSVLSRLPLPIGLRGRKKPSALEPGSGRPLASDRWRPAARVGPCGDQPHAPDLRKGPATRVEPGQGRAHRPRRAPRSPPTRAGPADPGEPRTAHGLGKPAYTPRTRAVRGQSPAGKLATSPPTYTSV